MNVSKLLFDHQDVFKVISVDNQIDSVNIYVQGKVSKGYCPNCELPSVKLHSYYTRRFIDLPVFGKCPPHYLESPKILLRHA